MGGLLRRLRSPGAVWFWLALFGMLLNTRAPVSVRPARVDAVWTPRHQGAMRVALVGDSGLEDPSLLTLRRTLRAEKKDVVLALGDLIYPAAPLCPSGALNAEAGEIMERLIGRLYRGLGAPVALVLGNHDVDAHARSPAREACYYDFAAREEDIYFPSLTYALDFGVAVIVVVNTNDLTEADGERVRGIFDRHPGWKILAGHHVLRTYHDKEDQDFVEPWLDAHGIRPDVYVNGHAHVQQFGVYDGIPAVTTGATAKLRERPTCPPECGGDQLWGRSVRGYAVLEVSRRQLDVVFKDLLGNELWRWSQRR